MSTFTASSCLANLFAPVCPASAVNSVNSASIYKILINCVIVVFFPLLFIVGSMIHATIHSRVTVVSKASKGFKVASEAKVCDSVYGPVNDEAIHQDEIASANTCPESISLEPDSSSIVSGSPTLPRKPFKCYLKWDLSEGELDELNFVEKSRRYYILTHTLYKAGDTVKDEKSQAPLAIIKPPDSSDQLEKGHSSIVEGNDPPFALESHETKSALGPRELLLMHFKSPIIPFNMKLPLRSIQINGLSYNKYQYHEHCRGLMNYDPNLFRDDNDEGDIAALNCILGMTPSEYNQKISDLLF